MAEDRVSKSEAFADVGAGLTGAISTILLTSLFSRPAGVSLTQQAGKALVANKDQLAAPLVSRLSKKDESTFAGHELKLVDSHNGVPFKDILTLLLKAMGPWASDRFRAITNGIPVPTKSNKNKVTKRDGTIEETEKSDPAESVDPRVAFLTETIKDVIRFGGDSAQQRPPDFAKGITVVLQNLKIRNIADADSLTAQVSRWWNEPNSLEHSITDAAKKVDIAPVQPEQLWFPLWIFATMTGMGKLFKPTPLPFWKHFNKQQPIQTSRRK